MLEGQDLMAATGPLQDAVSGPVDPWAHRSEGMTCATCIWFVPKQPLTDVGCLFGRCRRHSPTMGGFPAVFGSDWCGDHKLDENKIPLTRSA